MFIWLLMLSLEPIATLDSEPANLFLEPDFVGSTPTGEIFVLTKEQRLLKYDKDYRFIRTFADKGQGPGQLELASDMLWLEEKKELWVHDFLQRRIAIFNGEGDFLRNIKLSTASNSFVKLDDSILLCPQGNDGLFTRIDYQFNVLEQFKSPFEFASNQYSRSIWKMFRPEKLSANKIALGYVFANKITVINTKGATLNAMDMEHYYGEYPNPADLPLFLSQNTILHADDDQIWVLTCDSNDRRCDELLRINTKNGLLTGRSQIEYNVRRIQKLHGQTYAVIDRDNATVRIYDRFPFPIKEITARSSFFNSAPADSPQ